METTNYEINKKLAEIGFDGESEIWKHDPNNFITGQKYRAYDLQTLINALPKTITTKFKHFDTGEIKEFEEILTIYKSSIGYFYNEDDIDYYRKNYGYSSTFNLNVKRWEGESHADTAGRLLIQLYEAGIINFNK